MADSTGTWYNSRMDTHAPLFLINGQKMPFISPTDYIEDDGIKYLCTANPAQDYQEKSEQLVKSTRNANGEVVAHKINRRLNKFENLKWPYLSREQVHWLKRQIADFTCELTYFDDEVGLWLTREYYWGDFSATPCDWEKVKLDPFVFPYYFKRPTRYKDVSVNLIDMGKDTLTRLDPFH